MKPIIKVAQGVFLAIVFLLLVSRAVSGSLSHDENKFVNAGQALADYGWLPYRDYPYDQMPYTALFYALSAKLSSYDFLAARLMGALVWLACAAVLMAIVQVVGHTERQDRERRIALALLAIQIVVVLILVFHPQSEYVLRAAKNNSFATLFALLAFLAFASAVKDMKHTQRALVWSGACTAIAACSRLNYLALVPVLGVMWLICACLKRDSWVKDIGIYAGGVVLGGLPALALAAFAPAQTYYANIVQLRLTTEYFRDVLWRSNMDVGSKWATFSWALGAFPVNYMLYGALIAVGAICLYNLVRGRSTESLIGLTAAGFAAALLLTAFMATPMEEHYLFAPLPFLLILAALAASMLMRRSGWALAGMLGVLTITLAMGSTVSGLPALVSKLLIPASWPPLQVHQAAEELRSKQHIPPGAILSLLPMFTAEVGYEEYPFTVSGSNSWRTSLLLSAQKRKHYSVISPQELEVVLDEARPVAILTGIETPNPGFAFQDVGGLEIPFDDYARANGYTRQTLQTPFYGRPLTLWIMQP